MPSFSLPEMYEPAARIRRGGFSFLFNTAKWIQENDYYHKSNSARNCV